jgi:hypothetical protein
VVRAGRFDLDAEVCRLRYFCDFYLSVMFLDYGDLNEILWDCTLVISLALVVVSFRFWKAFFCVFICILINLLTLLSFDSIIILKILFSMVYSFQYKENTN